MFRKLKSQTRVFRAIGFWLSILLSLITLGFYVLSRPEIDVTGKFRVPGLTDMLEIIEARYLDVRFSLRGKRTPGDDVVIIGVDEKSDDELGRWQTSGRRWIARMLNVLYEGGAKVVGFDAVFPEPDEGSALVAVDEIRAYYMENNVQDDTSTRTEMLEYLERVKNTHDYDQQLAEAIERLKNVVLGIYHFRSKESAGHLTPEKNEAYHKLIKRTKFPIIKFPAGQTRGLLAVSHSFGVEPNLLLFSEAAKSFGHFNAEPYRDGYIRKSPLLIEYEGDYYPSLALEATRLWLGSPLPIIHAGGKESGGLVDSIQLGDIIIPTDDEGRLLINYYGPGYTFPHYSISDVVLRKIPPETFKNKIVLFGFTAASYQDVHSTTFEENTYPGVETHATVIENILRQEFLTRPNFTIFVDIMIILVCGLVLGAVLQQTRPLSGALAAIMCLIAVIGITYYAFRVQKIWLNMTFPFIFIILDYVTITSYKYFTEEKRKKKVKNAFQHYVSPAVVDQMLDKVEQLHLGGERKQLTALFSDIRGFTSISEKMEPEELVHFLNEYLTAMTRIVLGYEGTVDKYMGDAIMAFYGAPLEQSDHAFRACKSAVDMISRLKELQEEWKDRGLPPMNIGIGLNSGEMSVGNMGSEERFDYTIMGDNVNLASRLEGINKQYGTNIVISEPTYDLIRGDSFIVRELDSVQVKGKQEPVTIYELMGYGPIEKRTQTFLETFARGLSAYKECQWDQAMTFFQKVLEELRPDDSPSELYIRRCEEYKQTPPSEDWDGVFVMKTK